MSFPTYVTVPFDRTMTFASSSGPSAPSPSSVELAPSCPVPDARCPARHHPASLVLPRRLEIQHALRFNCSNAKSQKCRWRISLSRGSKSYSMSSRSMVSRCRRSTAADISSAISRHLFPPCSIECNVSSRAFQCSSVLRLPLRHARVEIPAVVIEERSQLTGQQFRLDWFSRARNPTTTSATCTPVLSI